MACIGNISSSLAIPCGTAVYNRIKSAKILNAADIASFTVAANGFATITRVATKVGADITVNNNAMTLTVGLKSQDITPGAYDVSVTFKDFAGAYGAVSMASVMGGTSAISRGEIVIAVEYYQGVPKVYGLGAPLVCLETVYDSTGDGFTAVTYGVEDWQVGTTIHNFSKADYDALSTPAAAAPGT